MLFWFQLVISQCFGTLATFSSPLLLLLFLMMEKSLQGKSLWTYPCWVNLGCTVLATRTVHWLIVDLIPGPWQSTLQALPIKLSPCKHLLPIPLICAVMVYIKIKIKGIVSGWLWRWRMPASMVYINLVCKYTVHITFHCTI